MDSVNKKNTNARTPRNQDPKGVVDEDDDDEIEIVLEILGAVQGGNEPILPMKTRHSCPSCLSRKKQKKKTKENNLTPVSITFIILLLTIYLILFNIDYSFYFRKSKGKEL